MTGPPHGWHQPQNFLAHLSFSLQRNWRTTFDSLFLFPRWKGGLSEKCHKLCGFWTFYLTRSLEASLRKVWENNWSLVKLAKVKKLNLKWEPLISVPLCLVKTKIYHLDLQGLNQKIYYLDMQGLNKTKQKKISWYEGLEQKWENKLQMQHSHRHTHDPQTEHHLSIPSVSQVAVLRRLI